MILINFRFKAKHEKDWANIIDLTNDDKEELLLNKTLQERKDELVMLEEFRRRKRLESFREKVYDVEREGNVEDPNEMPRYEPDPYISIKRTSGPPSRFFNPGTGEIFDPTEFTLIFFETDSVCLVTKLNRINHRRVLVFIGNGDGVISYGKGKGVDYQAAFQSAYMELKKNMICIDLDPMITLGAPIQSRFHDYRLWLYPRASPNYWGSPKIMHLLIYTGIYHMRFVVKSRKKDNYSLLYAYFMAVTKIKKPSQFAEITGRRFGEVTYNSPLGRSLVHYETHQFLRNAGPS